MGLSLVTSKLQPVKCSALLSGALQVEYFRLQSILQIAVVVDYIADSSEDFR